MRIVFTSFLVILASFIFAQTHFYIANRDGNNVLRYTMEGQFVEEFVAANSGGIIAPQEVLFHPVDGTLLVTGFNNTKIKQYDGETGDFIGDFSSGYNLSNPTKMIIGEDDLIYVTQWGSVQNKVVRFDLDGNFVDEWSSVGVPEGCGMAWDAGGNLLVTTWSNGQNNGASGFVRKFDEHGNDLGIVVNTSILQGPVGIWIDENSDLFVIDWTLGSVLKFDSTGVFKENFIVGMSRTEGNARGPDGKYYLCDWQLNRVNRYNADGTFDMTLVSSGLSVPNSLTFGPDGLTNTDSPLRSSNHIGIFPNPASDEIQIRFEPEQSEPVQIEVFDLLGKSVLFKDLQNPSNTISLKIKNLEKGMYQLVLSQGSQSYKSTFLKH